VEVAYVEERGVARKNIEGIKQWKHFMRSENRNVRLT